MISEIGYRKARQRLVNIQINMIQLMSFIHVPGLIVQNAFKENEKGKERLSIYVTFI